MTKQELSKYAGTTFYNLSRRPGGKFRDIDCLTIYEITERGTCRYLGETMGCVANKAEKAIMERRTDGVYHVGRPSAEVLTKEFVEASKAQGPCRWYWVG